MRRRFRAVCESSGVLREHEVVTAQSTAGLYRLGLLRAWPYADAPTAQQQLAQLEQAVRGEEREIIDVLDTGRGYAAWSSTYDERVNPLIVAEQPAIAGVLKSIPAGRALDAACGTGRLTTLLLEAGHIVTGVDESAAMIDRARLAAPDATYHVGSLQQLPFPDASFDIVCCGLALTHVAVLQPVVAEFARVLAGGGRLVISDVHPVAVATGSHAFIRRPDGSRCVVRNELHWHSEYLDAFAAADLRIHRYIEPRFSQQVFDAFRGNGGSSALEHLVGLPYALIWDCAREPRAMA